MVSIMERQSTKYLGAKRILHCMRLSTGTRHVSEPVDGTSLKFETLPDPVLTLYCTFSPASIGRSSLLSQQKARGRL